MKKEQIIILLISFFLGMLLLNMVKNVCGCELKEGFDSYENTPPNFVASPGAPNCGDYISSELCTMGEGGPLIHSRTFDCSADDNVLNLGTLCSQNMRTPGLHDEENTSLFDGLNAYDDKCANFANLNDWKTAVCGDPCQDVECGENGSCVDGGCICEAGYSGDNCATLQECPLQSHRLTAEYTDTQPENWISEQCSYTNRYSSGFTRDCGEWSRSDGFSSPRVSMKIASDDNDDNTAFCCRGREGTEVADLQKCMLPQIVCPTQDQVAGGYDAVRGGRVEDLHLPDRDARRDVCGGPLGRLYGCEGGVHRLLGHMHDDDDQRFCCDGPRGAVAKCTELTAETSR
jgi:hypothetical protein